MNLETATQTVMDGRTVRSQQRSYYQDGTIRSGKDRTIGGFQILQDTKKCDESRQLHNEGCLQEVRVEPGDIVGARSISSTSEEGRNDGNDYASGLLEKILHRDNMNQAYRRVKENKGSHGVDGMRVNELLPYLKQNGNQLRQSILEGTYNLTLPRFSGQIKSLVFRVMRNYATFIFGTGGS